MKINSNLAVIKTANVEIKTLTVSGKQVTLAVFRQLDQADLIDYDNEKLNGIVWGRVNYHSDKCADLDQHLHIIWQKENSLFRDIFWANQKTFPTEYRNLSTDYSVWNEDQKLSLIVLRNKLDLLKSITLNQNRFGNYVFPPSSLQIKIIENLLKTDKTEHSTMNRGNEESDIDFWLKASRYLKGESVKFEDLISNYLDHRKEWQEEKEVYKDGELALLRVKEESSRFHFQTYETLSRLDLLFIAV